MKIGPFAVYGLFRRRALISSACVAPQVTVDAKRLNLGNLLEFFA